MTPPARLQAAIEIVEEVVVAARAGGAAADTIVQRYFAARRYAGSKDRRAVRELVFAAIRRAGEVPVNGRAALIGLAGDRPDLTAWFDGSAHGPAPIVADEAGAVAGIVPAWLGAKLSPDDLSALLGRAPLDIRANLLKATRKALLDMIPEGVAGHLSATAIRLPEGTQVEQMDAWRDGLFEVQDEGSQLIGEACAAQPGMVVVDFCAGAGGKTLALAADMGGEGRLIACDVDRGRLSRLAPRAARAGADGIEQRLLNPGREEAGLADLRAAADIVLVDAPCSGSGTWRRNPEARWRLTPARLDRLRVQQSTVLGIAAPLVRPGGALVYAVCSLLPDEGEEQIAAFLNAHPQWRAETLAFGRAAGAGRILSPASDGTDGFFVARLRAP